MSRPLDQIFRRLVWPFALAEIVVWAAFYYSFPALLPEWERTLGWSKTELAGAFTIALVLAAVCAPVVGRLVDRGHARVVFVGCTVIGSGFLLLLSLVTEIWQFYGVWAGLGVAMSGALYEACFAIVTRSVGDRNKQAITLITLVGGLAGTVSFPTAHSLVTIIGWQGTVQVFAGATFFIAVPFIWFGCGQAKAYAKSLHREQTVKPAAVRPVTSSPVFWLLAMAFTAIAVEHGMVLTHLLPIMADRGINPEAAVFAASMIGPMQVTGRLAMMAAERHVSMTTIAVGCFVTMGVAALCLLGAGGVTGLVISFVILHGAGYGITSIMRPVITADFLGKQNFGALSGLLAVPFMLGVAIAPTLAALVWNFGGYDLVLKLAAGISGFGLLVFILAAKLSKVRS